MTDDRLAVERAELARWLGQLSYADVRAIEAPQPALYPDGRRVRGVEVALGVYVARDRVLYATTFDAPGVAAPLSLDDAAERGLRADALAREFAAKHRARMLLRRQLRRRSA